jgi:fucose permease
MVARSLRLLFAGRDRSYPLALVAFIALGLRVSVLGVAWPSIRDAFGLSQSGLGVVLFASGIGYMATGLLLGRVLGRIGVGRLLVLSAALLTVTTVGLALAPSAPIFLGVSFFAGIATGAIDASINFFATGHFSETEMNRLHGCFGIGALTGPVLFGLLLGAGASWRAGYLLIAVVLVGLTALFFVTRQLWETAAPRTSAATESTATMTAGQVLSMPIMWVCLVLFLCISGIEQTSGQWAFSVIQEGMGQSDRVASLWSGLFWGGMAFGRLTLGGVAVRAGTLRWIQGGVIGAALGGLVYALAPYPVAPLGLLIIGLSLSTVFPLMMMLTPTRVGQAALAHAVGFQMSAATIGSSLLPWIAGYLFSRTSYHAVAWVIVVAAIVLFMVHGFVIVWQRRRALSPG